MQKILVGSMQELKNILESKGDESLEICLENKAYELYETINIKRNNFVLNGNGAVIKGSRKIDISSLPRQGEYIKINLSEYGILTKNFHEIRFPWCGNYKDSVEAVNRDVFGTAESDGPVCGGSDTCGYAGHDIGLYYEGREMPVSRYPKEGYIKIRKTLSHNADNMHNEGGEEGVIIPDDEAFTKMEKAEEALLFGFWSYDWSPHHHSIKAVRKEENVIEVDPPYDIWGYWDARGPHKLRGKFYAINVYEALDTPGNWFVDRKTGELYIYPYPEQTEVQISVLKTFFEGDGVKHIKFKNFTLSEGNSCGFYLKNANDVKIENITVTNMGEWAIIADKSTDICVSDSVIKNTGAGGVYLAGGDRVSLTSSGNVIKNTEISDIAKWYQTYTAAIEIRGVGAVISGCKLHDLPHMAVYYLGNNHIIEKNEIYSVCNISNDAGAIYTGRDYTFYGNIIRHNYFHDFYGLDGLGCNCVYFDDCVSSCEVYGNIFANLFCAIHLGGGRDFEIYDNVFYNCDCSLVDNRGRNGFWANEQTKDMRKRLKASPYKNEVWKEAYPKLYNGDVESDDFLLPQGNSFVGNTFINSGDILLQHPDIASWLKMEKNTFIKRDKPKVFDENNASHLFRDIFDKFIPWEND